MCVQTGILWITLRTALRFSSASSRGFLRTSTSHTDVVSYSRLLSTDLSTVSTAVNTVKELTQREGDPITLTGVRNRSTGVRNRAEPVVWPKPGWGIAWEALTRAHRPAGRASTTRERP
jgi:hypothetical protein